MLGNPGSYANKKRKKPVLKQKRVSDSNEVVKSNPSKRHRDRLNGELDRLTDLLPFSEDIRTRLDKLSVLRLSVGYLRVKSYFKATMKNGNNSLMLPGVNGHNGNNIDPADISDGELLLRALNGFAIVVASDGLVFYVTPTIKDYLGFHQSDVVHQSVFELIHTDDRSMFRQQLHFALNPPAVVTGADGLPSCGESFMYSPEQLPPENSSFLERTFICRFRCLLDNSSGFLALKFQGRLKFLHGQRMMRDNGNSDKPQLGLFAIALPVQPPSIVEIRAKMLLFQTKHKLDFTPTGIDTRGKVVLGYSETELCMKGSGYQFIHAADMMYCADSHLRMMNTGETGMTVFRLLSKSGAWVWIKSNAKLIYKAGRPEFIIAYQRALVKAEGEEYLRQRRLQLPFTFTTGEAVLYNTGPSVDLFQFQFDKLFSSDDMKKDVPSGSLVDCFLQQDEMAYQQTVDPPVPVDQVFMDTRALISFPSDAWQENGAAPAAVEPVVIKQETKKSVMNMIDNLEKMAENGSLCSVLENLDVSESELVDLENALKRLGGDVEQQNSVTSELDSIISNDIFDYIDTVLYKEERDNCMKVSPPSCLTGVNNNQQDFSQGPPLFPTPSPDPPYSPVNAVYSHQQNTVNRGVMAGQPAQTLSSTQKLSHHAPLISQADPNLPPVQHLQLQDIFSSSIELPQLTVTDDSALFQTCGQAPVRCPQETYRQTQCTVQSGQPLLCPQNPQINLQDPRFAAATNGQFLQSSAKEPNNVAHGNVVDILPPLIPCNDFNSSSTPNISIPFTTARLQGKPPLENHNQQVQPWPQNQQHKLPHAGIKQNGHELMPACHSQISESQTFPHTGLWPSTVTGLNHTQQGELACGQAATQSSCMFDQHFSSNPAGGDVLALSRSSGLRGTDPSMDQSPPQGSCYLQWSHSEPVVGPSAISQENGSVSPLTAQPGMSSSEHMFGIQHYLDGHRQTQTNMSHCRLDSFTQQ